MRIGFQLVALMFFLFCFFVPKGMTKDAVYMITGEFAPFTSAKLENFGFFTEIVNAVFNEMALSPKYEFAPWKRCETQVLYGNAWAAFPYSKNKKRLEEFAFSDVVANSQTVFFCFNQKLKNRPWNKIEDLQPYRMGGVHGYFYENDFNKSHLNVTYTNKELDGIKNLINGKIDLLPLNILVGWGLIKKAYPNRIQHFGVLKKAYSEQKLHLMVLKSNAKSLALLEKFNKTLKKIKISGTYKKILARYNLTD